MKKTCKLNVRRETLRKLANVEISRVASGFDTENQNCVAARQQVESVIATCATYPRA